ncbi:hypothetical protein niasHT_025524 [Heterodera trifolii]|uniref:Uncharacterized protein n=1 Tax=Heterodera trifolii TaxID=157864 RepID=A0ABD2J8R1_9BILA
MERGEKKEKRRESKRIDEEEEEQNENNEKRGEKREEKMRSTKEEAKKKQERVSFHTTPIVYDARPPSQCHQVPKASDSKKNTVSGVCGERCAFGSISDMNVLTPFAADHLRDDLKQAEGVKAKLEKDTAKLKDEILKLYNKI